MGVLVCVLFAALDIASATIIKFKDGETLQDAVILEQGPESMRVKVSYGIIDVLMKDVLSIDGVRVGAETDERRPERAPHSAQSPTATPSRRGQRMDDAAPPSGSAPPAIEVAPYRHRWTMDLFLLGLVVVVFGWIRILLWVQKDVGSVYDERSEPVRTINAIVLLLPVVGLIYYLVLRATRRHQRNVMTVEAESIRASADKAPPAEDAAVVTPPKSKWRFLFRRRESSGKLARTREEALQLTFIDDEGNPMQLKKTLPGMSGIGAARELLAEAIVQRASDIHIEPREQGWRVRFRIDGVMQDRPHLAKIDTLRLVSSVKTLAAIDVAEKRKAQDGRFGVQTSRGEVDFRVATTSSIHGEKLVVRILERKTGLLTLNELGMAKPMLASFNRVLQSHNGMILVTGPTGSGKTTTLYAALNQLDAKKLNIMSIEDPVEYALDGATQIPVNPKAGLTYAAGLRSILRQDPDVIFVGEMRDEEAAKIAVRSALTGHLVFSSLHTNNAIGAIVRLMEIGVEKYQIASSVLLVVAQRLVRVLCPACREPYTPEPDALKDVGLVLPPHGTVYRARGCENCDNLGYHGRTAIFEMLVMDDEMREKFLAGVSEQELWTIAKRKGSRSLREDGVDKVMMGITTVDEVLQAQ